MPSEDTIEIATPSGQAQVALAVPLRARGLVLLGHGAGGGVTAPVLTSVATALVDARWAVGRVTQPYRVAGRRSPAPAAQLDTAWLAVTEAIRRRVRLARRSLVVGGKSSGARVACRTAAVAGAAGVVCLGFPLHPPGRPEKSRVDELASVTCPALVVQGSRDAFGTADDLRAALMRAAFRTPGVEVVEVVGDHSFVPRAADGVTPGEVLRDVAAQVSRWVDQLARLT